ncbi:MAG: hypothetical protein A2176_11610 [Spirochaetes bacterium RBG_13_51_14]|nr:MAG: hypothetical protein A2176_11610 [Spirochaetes bacterium RBG_13_51_14]
MQKITKKKIIVFTAVSVAIIVFFSLVRSCSKGSDNKYEYAEVTVGTVVKTISATGALDVAKTVNILSKTTGIIDAVHVDFNQEVKKGQLLATVDATETDQRLSKTAAQLESIKLELNIAKEDLETKKSMFKDNLISEKGMERAEYNYRTVYLKYKQIMVDYDVTREQKSYTRITSPINGIIMAVKISVNSPVVINAPLFVLAPSLKKMVLTISVDESDIGLIKKDENVFFTVSAFPNKTFRGKIDQVRINPVIKGGLVTYESIVACENDELLLKPGMTATATIEVGKKEKVLRVPNQALLVSPLEGQSDTDTTTVWRKTEKIVGTLPVEKVKVDSGLRGDNYTEIKKNLGKGERVLIRFIKGGGSGK